jgi:hypothetical protein
MHMLPYSNFQLVQVYVCWLGVSLLSYGSRWQLLSKQQQAYAVTNCEHIAGAARMLRSITPSKLQRCVCAAAWIQ